MNKEYMLLLIERRLQVLHDRYQETIKNSSGDSEKVQQVRRAAITRDMQIIKLLRIALIATPDLYIEDDDAIAGFDKLVTPIERHRRLKNKEIS